MSNKLEKSLNTAGISDVGRKRKLNEDSYFIDQDLGLLIVADGMGGHAAGEVASNKAVHLVHENILRKKNDYDSYAKKVLESAESQDQTWQDLPNPMFEVIESAVQDANDAIYQLNKDEGYADNQGMGTTIVGVWLQKMLDEAVIFNIGDSRLYLYREGNMAQLTKDHSLHQQWLDSGKIGPEPHQNIILYAMGLTSHVPIDIKMQTLTQGDLLLVCSDGLSNMVPESKMLEVLNKTTSNQLDKTCQELVDLANEKGGRDNITVALVEYV